MYVCAKHISFSGLVVNMLASGTQVRGIKPGWSRRIFRAKKILRGSKAVRLMYRFAACKRSRHLPWKSHAVSKIGSAIFRPYFFPSLIEVSHVADVEPLWRWRGKLKAVHKGPIRGCRAPDPPPLYSLCAKHRSFSTPHDAFGTVTHKVWRVSRSGSHISA
jgi:hypothetical protein